MYINIPNRKAERLSDVSVDFSIEGKESEIKNFN